MLLGIVVFAGAPMCITKYLRTGDEWSLYTLVVTLAAVVSLNLFLWRRH